MVVFWAETRNGWIKARHYFNALGGARMLEPKLWLSAQRLDSLDKNDEALKVLDWLVKRFPVTPRAPRYHETKMDILVRLKDEPRLEKGLSLIVNFYAPKSRWDRAHGRRRALQKHGRLLGEKAMAYVATYYHRQARKLGRQQAFDKAVRYYREFLRRFPRSRQALSLTFYLAETQSAKWARYVARTAAHPPFSEPSPAERVADFTAVFGDDWRMIEARFLRFMSGVR